MTRSVLVVDDDPEFRKLAERLLAASGLTVIGEADSVAAALGAALELKPSAMLVDIEARRGRSHARPRACGAAVAPADRSYLDRR